MPSSFTLGHHFEAFIRAQLSGGRYNNASEVVREALRLLEERDRRLTALDAALMRGVADIEAGRLTDAGTVFDRLEDRYRDAAPE